MIPSITTIDSILGNPTTADKLCTPGTYCFSTLEVDSVYDTFSPLWIALQRQRIGSETKRSMFGVILHRSSPLMVNTNDDV